jgi:hypothetical protein
MRKPLRTRLSYGGWTKYAKKDIVISSAAKYAADEITMLAFFFAFFVHPP